MNVPPPETISKLQGMVYELKVGDVMTRDVITVSPGMQVRDLREILRKNRISGLPVVDGEELVGIISVEDFIKCLSQRENGCLIEDRMTRGMQTLYADEPLTFAIDRFERHGMGRFPVLDRKSGRLVGILTKGDVIEGMLKKFEVDYHEEELYRFRASHIFEDIESDATTLVFQYEIKDKDIKSAGESSSRLKRTLLRLGIPPNDVRRIAIASYEAEMNVIIYATAAIMYVQVRRRRVLLEVRDSGPGIEDLERALTPGYSTAPDWVKELGFGAGMGLVNIKKMSDEFDIESEIGDGTCLRMCFFTEEGVNETQ